MGSATGPRTPFVNGPWDNCLLFLYHSASCQCYIDQLYADGMIRVTAYSCFSYQLVESYIISLRSDQRIILPTGKITKI